MDEELRINGNLSYVIDGDFRIVYYNEGMEDLYKDLQCGMYCYEAFMDMDRPCSNCPIRNSVDDDVCVFHKAKNLWLDIKRANIQWPGSGRCNMFIASRSNAHKENVLNRVPFMAGYDLMLEMNLTKNTYHQILRDGNAGKLSEEKQDVRGLVHNVAENLVHPDDRQAFDEFWNFETLLMRIHEAGNILHGEFREKGKDGVWDVVRMVLLPANTTKDTEDDIVIAFYTVVKQKITAGDWETEEKRIVYDALTGLPSGKSMREAVLAYIGKTDDDYCMLAMDIEHFRFFNKWYGRAAGDRLLVAIAEFFKNLDRKYNTMSGYSGGDNFFCVFPYDERMAQYIHDEVTSLIGNFEGIEGFRPAFGGYMIEDKKVLFRDMYDCATTAVERAVGHYDRGIYWYDDKMVQDMEYELRLLPKVEKGMKNHEFLFYLQPKYSISQDRVIGAEALIRWQHEYGMISPGQFLPTLEKNGFITRLDQFLWEAVCIKIREWLDLGYAIVPISINVSRKDFYTLDVPDYILKLTQKYHINPKYLEIEITESAFVEDFEVIRASEQQFRDNGFSVSIDDFGSGYSSLNMLKDIQADILKLDIKFLELNDENRNKGIEIVRSVFEMSQALNIPVIVEGVETEQQLTFLKQLGCDFVQGYYFYKPLPVEEFVKLIQNHN